MSKVSIIIPARNEKVINIERTIGSIEQNATGEYEIIIGYDGVPDEGYVDYTNVGTNLKTIKFPEVVGIKTNLNAMCAMATGKYIFKLDAHCRVGYNFDQILQSDMEEDWIVMPRFKIIKDDWSIQMRNGEEEFYDYFYLSCPLTDPRGFRFKAGGHWPEKTKERLDILIDETPQIHGSGWFISKDRFFELGGFPNVDPYGHAQEPIWLALKNWIWGGKVMVNKNTWYAHLHQQGNKRGYRMDSAQDKKSYDIAVNHFMSDSHIGWFVDKFWPMPTWPENWRELLNKHYSHG